MEQISSYGALIYKMCQETFHLYANWNTVLETNVSVFCARIPTTDNPEKKNFAVSVLKELKLYLEGQGAKIEDLVFLDDEIGRFEGTFTIDSVHEKDDYVDDLTIEKYSVLSFGIDGVMSTHVAFNYAQLKKLTRGVYKRSKFLRFYISPEITIGGKIVAELFEYAQNIPVCKLALWLGKNKEGLDVSDVFYFGEKLDAKKWKVIKEINSSFYIYKFISDTQQESILLSPNKMGIGDYIVNGVITPIVDLKNVGDSLKLPTNTQHIFVHSFKDKIIRYSDAEEFKAKLGMMNVNKSNVFNIPFCITDKEGNQKVLIYPEWFKYLIWSWLLHSNNGVTSKYPLHIFVIGDPNSGKTSLINMLHKRSLEVGPVFSGVSSTFKDLIPSFKGSYPKIGYLAESNRFSFLDEFLRCINRSGSTNDDINEQVALMNDLLEHQKRRAGSGNGSVNINMTSRVLSVTNPVRGVNNVTDLIEKNDHSFLSRWLVFWQPKEMVDVARNSKEEDLKVHDYVLGDLDFVSIVDFLQATKVEFDFKRVNKIFNDAKFILNDVLLNHYTARHKHHLNCIMDGLVKARCLFDRDISFVARDEDYEMLELIWANVIKSWTDGEGIEKLPIEVRHHYLPEVAGFAYSELNKSGPLTRWATEELLCKDMTKAEYITAMTILQHAGLVIQDNELVKVWWWNE